MKRDDYYEHGQWIGVACLFACFLALCIILIRAPQRQPDEMEEIKRE